MNDRESFIKRLRSDALYRTALGRARTPAERQTIAATVEGIVGSIGDVLGPLIDRAKRDPEFARQLGRAINGGGETVSQSGVLTDDQPVVSGSSNHA